MATNPEFWDNIAGSYASTPVKNVEGYEDTLYRIRKYVKPASSFLEVGCGTGTTALKLADLANTYEANDFSPELIKICKQRQSEAGEKGKHVRFQVADIHSLDTSKTAYDAVLALNTLHLLPNPPSTMNNLCKALKPGGIFVSKTHAMGKVNLFMKAAISFAQFIGKAPYISYMTSDDISKLHAGAGLQIIESKDYEKGSRRLVIARKN